MCKATVTWQPHWMTQTLYKGTDNSLARPATEKATKTEDFEFHVCYL